MDRSDLRGRYIVGAYATSPNLFSWDKDSEGAFFDRLKDLNSIRGLELPFWGESLHQFDDEWLLLNLHPNWQNVLTCVPGTMKNLGSDPYFGLASKKQSSRKNAIDFYLDAYKSVSQLKNTFGENSVIAILITSAPSLLPANSKETLVLVEFSKKTFNKTKPLRSFFILDTSKSAK